jgi:uncharacterized delta-60 repeat protein
MKRLILLAIGCFTCSLFTQAQVNIQWEERYTSAGSNTDRAADMTIDPSGNVYVTGTSYNGASTGFDLVTVKYDNAGTLLWTRTYDGPGNGFDESRAITIDGTGNVYVTGFVQNGILNFEFITLKYDPSGTLLWDRFYNQEGNFDEGRDIAVDGSGAVYVTGSVIYNSGNTDYCTVKYNAAGAQQWVRTYDGTGADLDAAFKIAIDGAGDIVVLGHSTGTTTNLDYALVKYNSGGTFQWDELYDGNSDFDTPTDLFIDGSDNIYITGFSYINALIDANYATLKYNAAGTQQWVATFNGSASNYDKANAIIADASGNVIVTGRSIGSGSAEDYVTIMYDSNGNEQWSDRYSGPANFYDEAKDIALDAAGDIYVTGYSFESSSNNDYTTVKYDIAGNLIWATKFNGSSNNSDQALAMAVDPTGNIYVTGESNGAGTGADYSTIKYCQLTTLAGVDSTICIGDSVSLNATGGTTFSWSPPAGLSCTNCPNPVATPAVTTTYIVSSTNANGCTDEDTLVITVNPLPGPTIYASGPTTFCIGDSVTLFTDSASAYLWTPSSSTNDSITVFTDGTYGVTVQDSMGCANTTQISVTVNQLPAVDAGPADSICWGDSTQLLAIGGFTYEWHTSPSLSDTTISNPWAMPQNDTTYYCIITDANGCSNWDSVMVMVHALPTPPVLTRLGLTLVSSVATGNQWIMNSVSINGATNQTYDVTQNGDYWVVLTDANGCMSTSDTISIVDISVNDLPIGIGAISLYPNPNNGEFVLEVSTDRLVKAEMRIINSLGQEMSAIENFRMNGLYRKTIDLENAAPGIYFLQLATKDGMLMRKVTVR